MFAKIRFTIHDVNLDFRPLTYNANLGVEVRAGKKKRLHPRVDLRPFAGAPFAGAPFA